jgi:hypothetical protein
MERLSCNEMAWRDLLLHERCGDIDDRMESIVSHYAAQTELRHRASVVDSRHLAAGYLHEPLSTEDLDNYIKHRSHMLWFEFDFRFDSFFSISVNAGECIR